MHGMMLASFLVAYCSGASPTSAWVSYLRPNVQSACADVYARFDQMGDTVQRMRRGWYDQAAYHYVLVRCFGGMTYQAGGWGADAFTNAISQRPSDNCTYEVVR